jgi:hypothetical protein
MAEEQQDTGASPFGDRAASLTASAASASSRSGIPSAVRPADFTDEYRKAVCRLGEGAACCRYLTMGGGGWGCAKRSPMREAIDRRADTMGAKGDNCDGCFEPLPAFVLLAQVDTHAERGDAKQAPSARMGSAVGNADAPNPLPTPCEGHPQDRGDGV